MRGRGPGFRVVLGIKEFRALWSAELLSILGDQLAGVALAVLVFQQTSSAALSALTYALTFAPAVLGGALLSGLADRFPRRTVLVTTDLLRAGLAGAMALPGLPLPVLWTMIGLLSMCSAPFKAAQLALLPQILDGDRYVVGLSLRQMTNQSAQLAGFASGGLLLVAVEPHVALAVNATTFLASAALIMSGVRRRPAATATAAQPASETGEPRASLARNRQLLSAAALVCLACLFVVPEGIAAPYGAAIGVGSVGVGLLMAADPLGSVIGAWLIARLRIPATRRFAVVLAAAAGVPLVLCAAEPGLVISITLWATSGALSTASMIIAQTIVVDLVPDSRRGRVMGRIATVLYTAQGLAMVAGGVAAEATGPFRAVAGAGLLGIVLVLCVGDWWRPVARSRYDLVTGSEHGTDVGEGQSHVPVRHDVHLLPNRTDDGEELGKDRSHVPVRHHGHLPSRTYSSVLGEDESHVPVRHRGHLLPRSDGSLLGEDESHVAVRHRGHLLARSGGCMLGEDGSHVAVRHQGHLLPRRFARTTLVTGSNERLLATELSSGAQATPLWVRAARAAWGRIVAGGVAT